MEKISYISVEEAFNNFLPDSSTVVTAMAACEPGLFFLDAHRHLRGRTGIRIYCANPSRDYEVFRDESFEGCVELRPMFLTSFISHHQKKSHVQYIPQHLSRWVRNILNEGGVDLFWGSCSVPDERGFVSLGPGVCYEYEILRQAKKVVLEVNPAVPFTYGSTVLPLKSIDAFLKSSRSLPVYHCQEPDEIDHKIAEHVAELIPDQATVQLGIGSIPNALTQALSHKKDLGIHTEMINEAVLDLYLSGVVTGRYKTLWPEKIVGSFAYGTDRLYRFLDRNPMAELHPASVVNDIARIGRNHRMFSVNSAVEIDLTGQVCSESVGHLELSGVGGATETHVGAQLSEGGMGIIAMKSATKKGIPKIVSELQAGAKVSVSRNDVDTVVTEYGVAHLRGKTVSGRALALIRIAGPDQKERLMRDAREFGYI